MEEQKNNSQMGGEKMCNGKTCTDGNGCMCGCGCGWARGHRLFRVVLAIVILMVVFWVGVKVGELKELVGGGYGDYGYRHAYPMMQNGQQYYGPTTNPPSAAYPSGRAPGATSSSPTGL